MSEKKIARLYRKMDWVNPEISHALLVFRNDYIAGNSENVKKILKAYAKRIAYEKALPDEVRNKEDAVGLQIEADYEGLNLPQFDYPPRVRPELLEEMQELMIRYGHITEKADLKKFVNQELLQQALAEIK
ncbi:MAG: hypothetical protein ABIG11_00325 [bacterium]